MTLNNMDWDHTHISRWTSEIQRIENVNFFTFQDIIIIVMVIIIIIIIIIRKVLRPATSTQVFLGFPVSISKRSDGSQHSKLPLHASHVALRT